MDAAAPPTATMRFTPPWRPYQQRVLDTLDAHLADRRLHVVAAPGSGKTILGLEVFRRLGRPAVILSPTMTIRDQWLARLEHFLPAGTALPPHWTSRDLAAPGFLTSITYQALHTKYRSAEDDGEHDDPAAGDSVPDADELSEVIRRLKEARIGTLILDEAHHLRQEWWKALSGVTEALNDVTLVSLTATPPYDVVGVEWRRYEELCGPIDEEIAVPELVKSGTLCAHQDYVWAVAVSPQAAQRIRAHDARVIQLTHDLLDDRQFRAAIEAHPWVRDAEPPVESVLDIPEFAVALLVYLRAAGRALPPHLLALLDTGPEELPALANRWWQVLVEHYLHGETWAPDADREAHREALAKRLRSEGLLHRRELRLLRSRPVELALAQAPDKIAACVAIHRLERQQRGSGLRQVILTDFIRDDDLEAPSSAAEPQLGALPIFRALVQKAPADQRAGLALLTGRLAIVGAQQAGTLCDALQAEGITPTLEPLTGALDGYVRMVSPAGNRLVDALTRWLTEGRLQVLVGTRALLGEGWDAPAVNSLVLASYVGSYMLSNQMRGRAIRRDPARPDKIASIWHIVAVAPHTPSGQEDVASLRRRFDAFVGVGWSHPVLESGIERLELPDVHSGLSVQLVNEGMQQRIADLANVARQWQAAIGSADVGRVLPSVRTMAAPRPRPFIFYNTLRYLLATVVSTFLAAWAGVAQAGQVDNLRVALWALAVATAGALAVSVPKFLRAAALLLRHLPVDGSLRAIATALYEALRESGQVRGGPAATEVRVKELSGGVYGLALAGATFRESAIFADCLEELLGPIENPRYLLTRPGTRWFRRRRDFHAVPLILGQRQETAAVLHKMWRRHMGGGELIYTRTPEGRRILLRARVRACSSKFTGAAQRFDRWQ